MLSHLLLLLAPLMVQSASIPMLNLPTLVQSAIAQQGDSGQQSLHGTKIEFIPCESVGTVHSIVIAPCQGGNGTLGSPCEFTFRSNYTITINYTSTITSSLPRSNLIANDTSQSLGPGNDQFPYSGQSFDGCRYTSCPILQDGQEEYVYNFRTLKSQFDALTFNVTDTLSGPSLICAGFPIKFIDTD